MDVWEKLHSNAPCSHSSSPTSSLNVVVLNWFLVYRVLTLVTPRLDWPNKSQLIRSEIVLKSAGIQKLVG